MVTYFRGTNFCYLYKTVKKQTNLVKICHLKVRFVYEKPVSCN